MIRKLTRDQLQTISQNNGLTQYLNNLLKGKEATQRSWLFENEDSNDVLERWLKRLSSLEKGDAFEKNVFQFDTSQLEKWGPQGAVRPISEIMDIVESGFKMGDSPRPAAFRTREWQLAKERVRSSFRNLHLNLRPASYKHVVDDMRARDTLESNSGWPLFTRRNKPEVIEHAIRSATDGAWKTYPAIALFRNYNQKTRLVWMFPMAANIVEGSFMQPLQSKLIQMYQNGMLTSDLEMVAPWIGFYEVRDLVTEYYQNGSVVLAASDFSETDAHFTHWHTAEVCDVISVCYQPQYRAAFRESLNYMHTIPLIIGPDSEMVGRHGVSSGSNFTNFIETIFDIIFAEYVHIKTNERVWGLYAIGDDMSWWMNGFNDAFAEELEQLGKEVGHQIKSEKTTNFPDKVKSLQRLFQRGYQDSIGNVRAVYSTIRALKSSIFPEKFHDPRKWNSDMFCARQFMILENCVDHPLFSEFVRFICSGSPYLIPFAKKSSAELARITRESKLIPGLNPTYNQEKRDLGLGSYSSVALAKEL